MTDSREDFGVVATDHSITAYQDCDKHGVKIVQILTANVLVDDADTGIRTS